MGYRVVTQSLTRGSAVCTTTWRRWTSRSASPSRSRRCASIGSDLRALFSLEFGKRREGEDEEKQNRRLAGGFAVSF